MKHQTPFAPFHLLSPAQSTSHIYFLIEHIYLRDRPFDFDFLGGGCVWVCVGVCVWGGGGEGGAFFFFPQPESQDIFFGQSKNNLFFLQMSEYFMSH